MTDWQPIESAPRDGTPVLLYSPDAIEPGVMLGFWCRFTDADDPDDVIEGWYDFWPDDAPEIDVEPTHWQPLPESPHQQAHTSASAISQSTAAHLHESESIGEA